VQYGQDMYTNLLTKKFQTAATAIQNQYGNLLKKESLQEIQRAAISSKVSYVRSLIETEKQAAYKHLGLTEKIASKLYQTPGFFAKVAESVKSFFQSDEQNKETRQSN
ncbi:MAG: hypothetical protein AAGJ35_00320, partial [Myxococcota bacterium]